MAEDEQGEVAETTRGRLRRRLQGSGQKRGARTIGTQSHMSRSEERKGEREEEGGGRRPARLPYCLEGRVSSPL